MRLAAVIWDLIRKVCGVGRSVSSCQCWLIKWSEHLLVMESTFQHVELAVCHVIHIRHSPCMCGSISLNPPKMENFDDILLKGVEIILHLVKQTKICHVQHAGGKRIRL